MSTTDADPDLLDQRVYLHSVSWEDYERLLSMRGDKAVPCITYLQGEVELMSPSTRHEWISKMIARLLEAWSEESGIGLSGFGAWTVKDRLQESGLEPDQCYILGEPPKERPDVAIEVVVTSGSIDKLAAYRRLEVPEVWFWKQESLRVFVLRADGYEEAGRSEVLPSLDLTELAAFVEHPSQIRAVPEIRAVLRRRFGTG